MAATRRPFGSTRPDRRLIAEVRSRRENCCRCGRPIDYDLPPMDDAAFSVDHYPYPQSLYPHLARDPANLRAAHRLCNIVAKDKLDTRHHGDEGLGETSRAW